MPPARKTTTTAEALGADGQPLLALSTKKAKKPPVPMEPAFTIDGRVISVPVKVDAQMAIRYMDHCRKKGENWALSWLLEKVLGAQAYQAVLEADLEDDELIAVAKIVQSKVLGDSTAPKG